jgi:hypothetical protein
MEWLYAVRVASSWPRAPEAIGARREDFDVREIAASLMSFLQQAMYEYEIFFWDVCANIATRKVYRRVR